VRYGEGGHRSVLVVIASSLFSFLGCGHKWTKEQQQLNFLEGVASPASTQLTLNNECFYDSR
jgi:hypothetical protein